MVKTIFFSEFLICPKLYGEGKCSGEMKSEFIILFIYYHLPSEDNIEISKLKKESKEKQKADWLSGK